MKPSVVRLVSLAGVAAVLAVHGWLIAQNFHMDGDTLRDAWHLAGVSSFGGAWTFRGASAPAYLLQGPVDWLVTDAWHSALPWWNELTTARVLTWLAVAAVAILLWFISGRLECGPAERALAALLPFCWHGFSFLVAECDDNAVTDALRLAAIAALLPIGDGRRRAPVAGLLCGLAVAWHFQSALLIPAGVVALGWGAMRRDGQPFAEGIGPYLLGGVAVPAVALAAAYAAGLGQTAGYAGWAAALTAHHDRSTGFWFLASDRGAVAQITLIAEGWGRMIAGYGWLRPGGIAVPVVVGAGAVALAVATLGPLTRSAAGPVLVPVLGIEVAHSLGYEPESVERWDVVALLSGLAAAVAVAWLRREGRAREARRLLAGWMAFGLVLAALNGWGWRRFVSRAEPAFLEVVEGRRLIPMLGLDCIGAHRRLMHAALSYAAEPEASAGLADCSAGKVPGEYLGYYAASWLGSYLVLYAPERMFRSRHSVLALRLFRPPAPGSGWRVARQDGFVYLLRRAG